MPDASGASRQKRLSSRFVRDWLKPQLGWFALGTLFASLMAACAFGYSYIISLATDWLKDGDQRVM